MQKIRNKWTPKRSLGLVVAYQSVTKMYWSFINNKNITKQWTSVQTLIFFFFFDKSVQTLMIAKKNVTTKMLKPKSVRSQYCITQMCMTFRLVQRLIAWDSLVIIRRQGAHNRTWGIWRTRPKSLVLSIPCLFPSSKFGPLQSYVNVRIKI